MKKGLLFVVLFFVFVFGLATPAFAQTFPPLNGHLIDGTGLVDATRFEAAVQPLIAQSAIPIGIAYNSTEGLGNNVLYDSAILNKYGYGVPAVALSAFPGATPLDVNAIVISIDYEGRNLMVYVGDRYIDKIGEKGISAISDEVAKFVMEDPTKAFEAGFAKANDLLDPPFNRAFRSFMTAFLPLVPYIVGTAIILMALVLLVIQQNQLSLANREIVLVREAMNNLTQAFEGANRQLEEVVNLLQEDYATEAAYWIDSATQPRLRMTDLNTSFLRLEAMKLNLFSSDQTMTSLVESYRALQTDSRTVENWIVSVSNEAKKLGDQVAGARNLLDHIEPEVERVSSWYEQAQKNSRVLPLKKHVFDGLQGEVDASKNLILYQAHGEIRGARLLENIRVMLEALEKASSTVIEAETMAKNTMTGVQKLLLPWAGELPSVDQLSTTPMAFLTLAVAQLTDDSDYNDVIEPAETAKRGFYSLGQVSFNKLVHALTKRDEVAKSLKSFFDQGYEAKHVAKEVHEAEVCLKAGLTAITSGEWQKAGNSLDQAKASSEAALSRMTYLANLRSVNEARLIDLSQKVAEAEKYRTAEVGPLWDSMQVEFSKANWMVVESFFATASQALADLFDHPSKADDLASKVATLNGFKEQKFEDAEKLLNELFRQKEQALSLLESIANRHALCVRARDTHKVALKNSQAKLDEAWGYVSSHNLEIDKVVDDELKASKVKIDQGTQAATEGHFVLALASADQAFGQIAQALISAKGQVSEITNLRDTLSSTKADASSAVSQTAIEIGRTHDSVVQEPTEKALRLAQSGLEKAQTGETGFSALEDHKLADALMSATNDYLSVRRSAQEAANLLVNDMSEYDKQLKSATSAVEEAQNAIDTAKEACENTKAGTAGDGDLSSAISVCPSKPTHGATRSSLQQTIVSANSAKTMANRAAELAQSARRSKEAEEAEEERERLAEAARKKAAEDARQDALDAARRASISASNNSSRQSSVGISGGGGGGGTRNTGGISGGRKF